MHETRDQADQEQGNQEQGDQEQADRTQDGYQPSAGVMHGIAGVILLVVGFSLLANIEEDPTWFRTAGLVSIASGLYCIIAGAVARGIQLGRR